MRLHLLAILAMTCGLALPALAQDKTIRFGAACPTPPPLHCPDSECAGTMIINQGPVVEMETRRPYFLDYPCDLKAGEKVTFILSLDGAGVATVYYPAGSRSAAVGVIGAKPLESSVVLDGTLGEEKLFGIFCEEPFELESLRAALARDKRLPPLPRCHVDELSIQKQKAP